MTTALEAKKPLGEHSGKASRAVVKNPVPLPDIKRYLRAELRLSKRDADWMARQVYRDPELSRTNLPAIWHQDIWPTKGTVSFVRRSPNVSDPTPRDAIRNIEGAA